MSILALTSDTLAGTPAAGQIEYNGQFYGTDSNASRAQMQRITQGTAVASTSGTSIDFTGLPAWIKRITVMLSGVSTSGSSAFLVQIGSGSVDATGYTSSGSAVDTAVATATYTTGYGARVTSSGYVAQGTFVLTLLGSNIWLETHTLSASATPNTNFFGGGVKTLSGTLDRVRITTVNGTDTFDAGSVNIMYEG